MTTHLHISIGPVQGFVAQARRTRDLWGSSYLLSFLSAHAMYGAEQAGGNIIQPVVEDDRLYRWVSGDRTGDSPKIGTLPNHFVVEVDNDARLVAKTSDEFLRAAWKQVCDVVWKCFVANARLAGNDTEAIWNRQVHAFWEVMWTAELADGRAGLLAHRKHWRTHRLPDEPGDKCTVMHDLQELSGHVRARHRVKQDKSWKRMNLSPLDLRPDERLCAIALVKRLFPKVASLALGWSVDASHWPSTVYVGAVPWIREVIKAVPQQAREYAKIVEQNAQDAFSEQHPSFTGLNVAAAGGFPKLDANYFHCEFVTSERLCPLVDGATAAARKKLACRLKTIYDAKDAQGRQLGTPTSFYALLLADGDHLGRLVGKLGGEIVSKALAAFTCGVPDIVKKHDGVTVYAGGDDVLAMLSLPKALTCAETLSDAYRDAFAHTDVKDEATLSAAVVFAHVRLPLNYVLGEAHRLLDEIAKDGNGRDSLVASVLKPGGLHCQWVTTWTRHSPNGDARAVTLLDGLVRQLDTNKVEPGLSSALIYRMRDTLTRLCGWEQWQPGNWSCVPKDLEIRAFLHAEIHHSLDVRMDGGSETRTDELTADVWNLLGPAQNPNVGDVLPNGAGNGEVTQAGVDALLLARFLADPEQRESDR